MSNTNPNRGDLFEVIFASAVAARFERRFKSVNNIPNKKVSPEKIELYQLPRVTNADVKRVMREVIPLINRGRLSRNSRVDDVIDTGENAIFDNIRVRISVPTKAATWLASQSPSFSEVNDMILETTRLANSQSILNSRAKGLAINGKSDFVLVEAAGTRNQKTTKADVKVKIRTGGKTQKGFTDFSCKVPGGEQFHQVSGGSYQKFEELFTQMGITLDNSTEQKWLQSFDKYLSNDIFTRKFASRSAIYSTKIPIYLKNNATRVYLDAYRKIKNAFEQNSPLKRSILQYIYNGFTRGVDTELVKLTGSSTKVSGFKSQLLNPQFFDKMMSYDYEVSLIRTTRGTQDSVGSGRTPQIILSANVMDGGTVSKKQIFSIRYKWENRSVRTRGGVVYKIYPRHYLESLDGFFYL
jgi:hypothetical protein